MSSSVASVPLERPPVPVFVSQGRTPPSRIAGPPALPLVALQPPPPAPSFEELSDHILQAAAEGDSTELRENGLSLAPAPLLGGRSGGGGGGGSPSTQAGSVAAAFSPDGRAAACGGRTRCSGWCDIVRHTDTVTAARSYEHIATAFACSVAVVAASAATPAAAVALQPIPAPCGRLKLCWIGLL